MKTGLIVFFLTFVTSIVFQNCGFWKPYHDVITMDLPSNHPSGEKLQISANQLVMGDKEYLESVFTDVFGSPSLSQENKNVLQSILFQEFTPQQQVLGRACDPIREGSTYGCYYSLTNAETGLSAASSAIREGARIQVCRRMIANEPLFQNAVAKIKGNSSTPTDQSIGSAIELFFPAREPDSVLQNALSRLDGAMATNSESADNRWRMLLLTLCESPSWQIL